MEKEIKKLIVLNYLASYVGDLDYVDLEELLGKNQEMLERLIEFNKASSYYRKCPGVEREIEALSEEIKEIEDYLQDAEDNPRQVLYECPFCKIEMLEEDNENLFDENIQLIERLQEQDKEINDLNKLIIKLTYPIRD